MKTNIVVFIKYILNILNIQWNKKNDPKAHLYEFIVKTK